MDKDFFRVVPVAEFKRLLCGFAPLDSEPVSILAARARVAARDVISPENLPLTGRSGMDGFAVAARDTFGASESSPACLECVGRADIQDLPDFRLEPGQCSGIVTGGSLPEGADAVVMIERTQDAGGGMVEIQKAVAPGENVMLAGEDCRAGETIIRAGYRIRPQEIGHLAALGLTRVQVTRPVRVGIISTGDELTPIETPPVPGKIRDVNSFALSALVSGIGCLSALYGIVRDELPRLVNVLRRAVEENDVVLISGGSSVGMRDFTHQAIQGLPEARILAHGVAISPGKPTILAASGAKCVWGLPGQVTSAQVVMHVLGLPFLRHLSGERDVFEPRPWEAVLAELGGNVVSKPGREEHVRVRLRARPGQVPLAEPILGKSGLLRTLTEADGLAQIDDNVEGIPSGSLINVRLLR